MRDAPDAAPRSVPAIDLIAVAIAAALPTLVVAPRLGFYSDDWFFLALLEGADARSAAECLVALLDEMPARPIQAVYLTLLFQLFGRDPLGYHLVNAVVFATIGVLMYLTTRAAFRDRVVALAVALVFSCLPHYSTARLWVASSHVPLSVALCLFSVWADSLTRRLTGLRRLAWEVLSTSSLVVSVLAYEIVAPLFLASPFLFAGTHRGRRPRTVARLGSNLLALAAVMAFKLAVSDRWGVHGSYALHLGKLVIAGGFVNFGIYGLFLPWTLLQAVTGTTKAAAAFLPAALIGGALYIYLRNAAAAAWTVAAPQRLAWARLTFAGLLLYLLGYGVFLFTYQVGFSPSGAHNRTATAAALGISMCWVGGLGWWRSGRGTRSQASGFALWVTALCLGGFLISVHVASFWIRAWARQQEIVQTIRGSLPQDMGPSTVLLEGICPWIGPGIVFEAYWDVTGMLRLELGNPSLEGDVARQGTVVSREGIETEVYGERRLYPYGETLLVLDVETGSVTRLSDALAAKRHFGAFGTIGARGCPPGREGHGVQIFSPQVPSRETLTDFLGSLHQHPASIGTVEDRHPPGAGENTSSGSGIG